MRLHAEQVADCLAPFLFALAALSAALGIMFAP